VLLKVQRFHSCSFCAGAAVVNSAELECGQFDDEFVQALKVTVSKTDASTQVWLAYDPIPHIDIATSSMTIYMFYGHAFPIREDRTMALLISSVPIAELFFGMVRMLAKIHKVHQARLSTISVVKEARLLYRVSDQDLNL
jgi:hypothetical protein